MRGGQRFQVASLMDKQWTAYIFFKGMQGAMHADIAQAQLFSGAGDVAAGHKGDKDFQLAKTHVGVDFHAGSLSG
ncbi:hypothetical protein Y888_20025 [Mixta calida B021323]|nr:hypothetical protein Y888_20025 [Mixta calida B021323]ORM53355.1 hypothetical protein HA40_17785 [Mixta calida]